MTRLHLSSAEITEVMRALEAGIRVPAAAGGGFGLPAPTPDHWRRRAGRLDKPKDPVTPVALDIEQATNRIAGLERRLEAFRLVLVTLLEPPELERAARLLEVSLSVSPRRARLWLGLPPHDAPGAPSLLQIADGLCSPETVPPTRG